MKIRIIFSCLGKRISVERHIFYALMLCTVADTVGVLQNYRATTLTSFIVLHPIIRDQLREEGREKLVEEIGKKERENKDYIKYKQKERKEGEEKGKQMKKMRKM
jgi:hypothetical protein